MPVRLAQKHISYWAGLLGIDVVHLNIALITPDFVEKLHESGLVVSGSNLDMEEQIQHGLKAGINAFSTFKLETAVSLRNGYINSIA